MIPDDTITIGSDESLKGDTFGGLTIAAVLATKEQREQLSAIGVDDSKKIADHAIRIFAQKIRKICPYTCVKNILPDEYNQYSLTGLLNRHHSQCYLTVLQEFIKTQPQQTTPKTVHIVDKYPGCDVGDIVQTKAESKYVAVAAASILAREAALDQFDALSKQAGFLLPKGSTHVEPALRHFFSTTLNPAMFLKLHFKNVRKHLSQKHSTTK